MNTSEWARTLAEADDHRIRSLRRGNLLIALGVVLCVAAWLMLPFGVFQLATASMSVVSLGLVIAGALLLTASVLLVVRGITVRRRAVREHAAVSAFGKANPAFGEDRKTVPTGGVPISWMGGVPGS